MCGVDGYSVINAVYVPYTASEFDTTLLESGDTFTCAANTRRIFNAIFEPSEYSCDSGYYLPSNGIECVVCPANSYCPGGTYTFNETSDQGINQCAPGLYAPTGMWVATQCGHILHIGDASLYLHATKKTSPAIHIKIGNEAFYGNMTTADVPMNIGTNYKLRVNFGNTIYSVYDDTVSLPTE